MNKLASLALLVVAVLILNGCNTRQGKKPKLAELERVPRLETIQPKIQAVLAIQRDYTATVEPFEKADLYAQVRGTVSYRSPNTEIGSRVRGEHFAPTAVATGLLLAAAPLRDGALSAVGTLLAGRSDAEVLVTLAIPDVLADRDNKRALLEQAVQAREQMVRARDVAAEEVKEAEAQTKRWHAEADFRALQYQRVAKLVASDTVQKQLAEEARLQHRSALAAEEAANAQLHTKQARLRSAEGEVALADAKIKVARSELERLEATVAFATIRAPFDGVVTRRWVDLGTTVKDFAAPLLTVMRTDVVRVLIDVPERDESYLRAAGATGQGGNRARLRVPSLEHLFPGGEYTPAGPEPKSAESVGPRPLSDSFPWRVQYLASALDPVTRTMRVELHVPNRPGHLKPQMTGTVTLLLEERKDAITVPSSALVRQGGKVYVFHIESDRNSKHADGRGVVRRAEIEAGLDDGQMVHVRRGLGGQEQIITKGNGVVREGDFAIAVPTNGDKK
jgi:RND family efflux transporter MFP subunit